MDEAYVEHVRKQQLLGVFGGDERPDNKRGVLEVGAGIVIENIWKDMNIHHIQLSKGVNESKETLEKMTVQQYYGQVLAHLGIFEQEKEAMKEQERLNKSKRK